MSRSNPLRWLGIGLPVRGVSVGEASGSGVERLGSLDGDALDVEGAGRDVPPTLRAVDAVVVGGLAPVGSFRRGSAARAAACAVVALAPSGELNPHATIAASVATRTDDRTRCSRTMDEREGNERLTSSSRPR